MEREHPSMMEDPDTPASPTVRATETSFRVIEGLRELEGAGVTDLAAHLKIPKSTVHNHLQTLQRTEYVIKRGDEYDVGLRFLGLGEYARNRRRVARLGCPEVDKLADQTEEMANLFVAEHGQGVYIYCAKGSEAVHMDTHAGKRVHLHTTGLGKSILAYLPEERVEAIIDYHGLPVRTEETTTDRETLYDELAEIRERGYAFDDEERLDGLRCIAAPVVTSDTVIGAVSVSGPKSRLSGEWYTEELPSLVTSAANVIEINITFA